MPFFGACEFSRLLSSLFFRKRQRRVHFRGELHDEPLEDSMEDVWHMHIG